MSKTIKDIAIEKIRYSSKEKVSKVLIFMAGLDAGISISKGDKPKKIKKSPDRDTYAKQQILRE